MANTGINQAVVVYKVRTSDNAPLDTDGNPLVIVGVPTGRKQAVAILAGTSNPNPAIYDVELTFPPNGVVFGVPTSEISDNCVTGYIFLSPAPGVSVTLTAANPTANFDLISSAEWTVSVPAGVAVTPIEGLRGTTAVVFSRSGNGQGLVSFTNIVTGQKATAYVISVNTLEWILETGTWNMAGIWTEGGLWNY